MAKSGTTVATGNAMKSASTSGVRHGASTKNVQSSAAPRGVNGKNMSSARLSPIKGSDKGFAGR